MAVVVLKPNQTVEGFSPDGLAWLRDHPQPGVIPANSIPENSTIYMTTGDYVTIPTQTPNDVIVMGGGNESVGSSGLHGTVYGGSGNDTVGAFYKGNTTGTLTFIGGSGTNTAYGVFLGVGGSGHTTMEGVNNSTLYAGTGHTEFDMSADWITMTIGSFLSGKDVIGLKSMTESMLATALSRASYANGYEAIPTASTFKPTLFVHTDHMLTTKDFKLLG